MQLMSVNGVTVPPDVHPVTLIDSPWNGTWNARFGSESAGGGAYNGEAGGAGVLHVTIPCLVYSDAVCGNAARDMRGKS
jgi:hypothetical protein